MKTVSIEAYLSEISLKRNMSFCYRIRQGGGVFQLVIYKFHEQFYDEHSREETLDDYISFQGNMKSVGNWLDHYEVIFAKADIRCLVEFFL